MTEIICRLDIAKKQPVVFITDSIDNGQILAWTTGQQPTIVGLDYYHQTGPLSAADEEILKNRYAKAMADKSVYVRHRLPRVRKHIENILAKPAPAPAAANKAPRAAPRELQPEDIDIASAIKGLRAKFDNEMDALLRVFDKK